MADPVHFLIYSHCLLLLAGRRHILFAWAHHPGYSTAGIFETGILSPRFIIIELPLVFVLNIGMVLLNALSACISVRGNDVLHAAVVVVDWGQDWGPVLWAPTVLLVIVLVPKVRHSSCFFEVFFHLGDRHLISIFFSFYVGPGGWAVDSAQACYGLAASSSFKALGSKPQRSIILFELSDLIIFLLYRPLQVF